MRRDDINTFTDSESRRVGIDNKSRQTFGPWRIASAGKQYILISQSGIGYPGFYSVDDVFIAIKLGGDFHAGNVRATAWF